MQAWLNLDADDRQTAFHMPGDVKVNSRIDVSRHDRSAGSPLKRAGLISVHVTRPYNGRSNNPAGKPRERGSVRVCLDVTHKESNDRAVKKHTQCHTVDWYCNHRRFSARTKQLCD